MDMICWNVHDLMLGLLRQQKLKAWKTILCIKSLIYSLYVPGYHTRGSSWDGIFSRIWSASHVLISKVWIFATLVSVVFDYLKFLSFDIYVHGPINLYTGPATPLHAFNPAETKPFLHLAVYKPILSTFSEEHRKRELCPFCFCACFLRSQCG